MKFRILVTLAFLISSLTSCENTPGIAPVGEMEVLPYYDLKGFVLQEIEKMDSSNQVSKITRINGEEKRSDVTFSKEDWNDIFTFFQKRLIKLDRFWSDAKETFIDLSN